MRMAAAAADAAALLKGRIEHWVATGERRSAGALGIIDGVKAMAQPTRQKSSRHEVFAIMIISADKERLETSRAGSPMEHGTCTLRKTANASQSLHTVPPIKQKKRHRMAYREKLEENSDPGEFFKDRQRARMTVLFFTVRFPHAGLRLTTHTYLSSLLRLVLATSYSSSKDLWTVRAMSSLSKNLGTRLSRESRHPL
jgi:hypothetical protein